MQSGTPQIQINLFFNIKAGAHALIWGVQNIMTKNIWTNARIESANAIISAVSGQLRAADKEYRSISSVLKDIQRRAYLKAGYRDVFAAVGVDVDTEKLEPTPFFRRLHETQWGEDKKGNRFVGIWGTKKQEDGTKAPVLRKVTAWTPRKVFQVLAQSIEAAK